MVEVADSFFFFSDGFENLFVFAVEFAEDFFFFVDCGDDLGVFAVEFADFFEGEVDFVLDEFGFSALGAAVKTSDNTEEKCTDSDKQDGEIVGVAGAGDRGVLAEKDDGESSESEDSDDNEGAL